jgi:hypothetical protein
MRELIELNIYPPGQCRDPPFILQLLCIPYGQLSNAGNYRFAQRSYSIPSMGRGKDQVVIWQLAYFYEMRANDNSNF